MLQPPENATGNAPRQDYFPSKVYWNPPGGAVGGRGQGGAKLFAPADVERIPPLIVPLQQNTMLTVVVGTPFHGTIAPASPTRTPTTREPAHVVSNPYDTTTLLARRRKRSPSS